MKTRITIGWATFRIYRQQVTRCHRRLRVAGGLSAGGLTWTVQAAKVMHTLKTATEAAKSVQGTAPNYHSRPTAATNAAGGMWHQKRAQAPGQDHLRQPPGLT